MSKVAVIGGLGHIGSSLPSEDFTFFDNFYTQRYCSLFNRKMNFIESGMCKADLKDFDVIILLAAVTDAVDADSFEIRKINMYETRTFIDKWKHKRIVFPSSTSVYGRGEAVKSEVSSLSPQSDYAHSKVYMENYVQENVKDHVIMRLGTIAGVSPGMRFHTAINKFCYQASVGQPLSVWKTNWEMQRPYLSLKDAISFIEYSAYGSHVGTYNVVTLNESTKNIVELIVKETGAIIKFVDTPLLNQQSYIVSRTKSAELGFKYEGNIYDDIKDTLNLLEGLWTA